MAELSFKNIIMETYLVYVELKNIFTRGSLGVYRLDVGDCQHQDQNCNDALINYGGLFHSIHQTETLQTIITTTQQGFLLF